MTDLFAYDDAAYVLGALEGTEREQFEAHLLECPDCAERVQQASALADLLAFVPADAYGCGDGSPPASAAPRPQRSGPRPGRRWHYSGIGALAAACLAVLVVLVWPADSSTPAQQQPRAMAPVAATSLRASAALEDMPWGTAIEIDCHDEGPYPRSVNYTLLVVGQHDERYPAGSWRSTPGAATEFIGGAALPRGAIAAVEILADNRPVLVLTLH